MASGNLIFFQYGDFGTRGSASGLGNTLFLNTNKRGCQATVTISNGIVAKVTYKKKGLISGPLACSRIFSEC